MKSNEVTESAKVIKRHSFDLDVSVVKKLKLHSIKENTPMYTVVENAIRKYLKDYEALKIGGIQNLKISNILELTIDKNIAEVAKEDLRIEEKEVRRTLKYAGCYVLVGQQNWLIDEDEVCSGVLDRSFQDVHHERLKVEADRLQ